LFVNFAYNNALSATTSILPFFANKSYYLSIKIYSEQDIASFYVYEFTIDLDKLQDTLKAKISAVGRYIQDFSSKFPGKTTNIC